MDEDLHRLLLRLGGVLPPEHLAEARLELARGNTAAVLGSVTRGLGTAGAPIAAGDLDRLTALAESAADAEALRATQQARTAEPQYLFRPIAFGDVPEDGAWVPPIVDLTARPWMHDALYGDDRDLVAVEAVTAVPGAVAVWRTWRETVEGIDPGQQVRVVLVEVDQETAALPARVAAVMAALADTGEAAPLVEMRSVRESAPAYFLEARQGAALLWAAEAGSPVAIAKAFDGVDPDDGPYFSEDHERLDDQERARVLRYLDDAPVLLSSTERMLDILEPDAGLAVPLDHRTDGRWTWTDSVAYYLRHYGLAPDPEFLAAIRAGDYTVPEVTAVGRHRAIAELFMPVDAQPASS